MGHLTIACGLDDLGAVSTIESAHRRLSAIIPMTTDPTVREGGAAVIGSHEAFTCHRIEIIHQPGRGLLVSSGVMIDRRSSRRYDANELLQDFLNTGTVEFPRYQGAFVAFLWNSTTSQGIAFHDQTAVRHFYWASYRGLQILTTVPLAVAAELGLPPCPEGIVEFLSRGTLCCPTSMIQGVRKLNIGEHAVVSLSTMRVVRHWIPYCNTENQRFSAAVDQVAQTVQRVVRGHQQVSGGSLLFDLTGGYDSRTAVAGAHSDLDDFAIHVVGATSEIDVRIAQSVASAMGWRLVHFDPRELWTVPMEGPMRREAVYRLNAEMPFTNLYHHLLARPIIAREFPMTATGGGADFLRYFPWGQEFWGIGRHSRPSLSRLIDYRFHLLPPPPGLGTVDWSGLYRSRLIRQLNEIFDLVPDALSTQHLDAAHLWKVTGHYSMWSSSLAPMVPNVAPNMTADFVEAGISLPWRFRLSSGFQRSVIATLNPRLASLPTAYGASAAPPSWSTLGPELRQFGNRASHLIRKVWRVVRKQKSPPSTVNPLVSVAHAEFWEFLRPEKLACRGLFHPAPLARLLNPPHDLRPSPLVLRIATLEHLCRELNAELDPSQFN